MLKFYEVPCDQLFQRTFTLELNGSKIGGSTLKYIVGDKPEDGLIEITDVQLLPQHAQFADLLAGASLNAACNTDVERVRVSKADYWERFGLEDLGDYLEQHCDKIVFDSVCKSRDCATCGQQCSAKEGENTK